MGNMRIFAAMSYAQSDATVSFVNPKTVAAGDSGGDAPQATSARASRPFA